ncbi:variable surface protein [Plasmodium gonderi]|uniref:Variable surface protein n=1 Tax=Plasmodium gonderi TaxID=77519 RepID=A0A1Y1JNB8_PLAGO|nr:variable surface protein [Plasmodium gonderi]GAW84086.1 variable surface protein [Plasmodium gonderi]
MSNEVAKVQISFKDIFPTCQDNYNISTFEALKKNKHLYHTKIEPACKNISRKFTPGARGNNTFHTSCDKLGYYLYKIKGKNEKNRKHYCEFFIYELKREVKNKVYNIPKFVDVYNQLMNAYKDAKLEDIDVCNEYVSLMDDELLYQIFEMFDKLYKNFKYLKNENRDKDKNLNECVKVYDEIIKKDKKEYNNFVQNELEKFKSDFHKYLRKISYNTEDKLLTSSLMISPEKIRAEKISGNIASPVTWTSTIVLFFAILIIIFIVYNYTSFGSYFLRRRRKLRNKWYTKNKKHYELMNLFEESQKNIIQNKHNILYKPAD